MVPSRRFTRLACLALGVSLLAPVLLAEERAAPSVAAPRERAAALYDRGVAAFERADYESAAQSFLDADTAAPSSDAVRNALAAARRANDPALVRAAAERGARREASDPELAAQSRAALAELEPSPSDTTASGPALASPAGGTSALAVTAPAPEPRDAPAPEAERTWPRPVFYAGAVATGALVGVTIWSGIDALRAKGRLPGTQADNDDVKARAHRTDALLASSLVVGAATAYVGLVWVDWKKHPSAPRAAASVDRRGAYVVVSGDF